jgi:predicted RNA-binding protein YlqC (UPF0109 family)
MAAENPVNAQALIEHVAKSLVDAADQVSVNLAEDEDGTVIELKVAETDLGKVIGKQGRIARAMRGLLGVAGLKSHKHYTLEILE